MSDGVASSQKGNKQGRKGLSEIDEMLKVLEFTIAVSAFIDRMSGIKLGKLV